MEAKEFIDQAERLAKKSVDSGLEVDFRTAVSRAYYGAYHTCDWLDQKLDNHGGMAGKKGIHEVRHTKFSSYPAKTNSDNIAEPVGRKIKQLGYKLRSLHGQRILADYKLEATSFEGVDAALSIKEAKNICLIMFELKGVLEGAQVRGKELK